MNLIAVKRNEKVLVACRVTIKEVDAAISRAVYIYTTQELVCRCRIKEARMTPCVLHFT